MASVKQIRLMKKIRSEDGAWRFEETLSCAYAQLLATRPANQAS